MAFVWVYVGVEK